MFFFEKKNQKTFTSSPSPRSDTVGAARTGTDKSFLVLFFKKEHFLPFLKQLPQHDTSA